MKLVYKGKRRTDGKITLFKMRLHRVESDYRTIRVVLHLPLSKHFNLNAFRYLWVTFLSFQRSPYVKPIKKYVAVHVYDINYKSFDVFCDLENKSEIWYERMKLDQAVPIDNVKIANRIIKKV